MAEAAVQGPTTSGAPKYFCHKCSVSIDLCPELPELTCPKCESGFVEEMSQDFQSEHISSNDNPSQMLFGGGRMPGLFSSLLLSRMNDSDEDSDADDDDVSDVMLRHNHFPLDSLLSSTARHRLHGSRSHREQRNPLPSFLEELIRDLTGNTGRGPSLLPFLPSVVHGDPRDYAWGTDGVDNIVTQLLDQWESPGSPPASNKDIDELPTVTIAQEHLDKEAQCSVCMDDHHLGDVVRGLPCQHLFHTDCINPWLLLHNTCPVCRQPLGTDPGETGSSNVHESTDTSDSSDSDSSGDEFFLGVPSFLIGPNDPVNNTAIRTEEASTEPSQHRIDDNCIETRSSVHQMSVDEPPEYPTPSHLPDRSSSSSSSSSDYDSA